MFYFLFCSIKDKFLNSFYSIDADHFFFSIMLESEKEIGAADDCIILIIFVFFSFSWYFMLDSLFKIFISLDAKLLLWVLIPFIFVFIFIIPTFLLLDFGLYFFVYLRGSGTVSALAGELMFDCINLFGFYIRVYVQCVRIILMLTTIGSLQETILELGHKYYCLGGEDSFSYFICTLYFTNSIVFDLFLKFIFLAIYFVYEIFHTYFVITIQTIAFFAMVF